MSLISKGAREDRSTLDQIFILTEIMAYRLEGGFGTYMAFIDVRKAYDRVWRPGLWTKLKDIGLGGRCHDLLRTMYSNVVRQVLIHGRLSEGVEVEAGVPQGSVLSPFLYSIYIDGLHAALRERGLGVSIFGRLVPLLFYADDIVLLARSGAEIHEMLEVLDKYAPKWRFNVNHGKSKVMVGGTEAARAEAREDMAARRAALGGC